MLELYHTVNSVCAKKIRIQLEEEGLPWGSRLMTLRGDQFDPAYLKLNPNAVVPTLVHDGFPVIESSVIPLLLGGVFPGAVTNACVAPSFNMSCHQRLLSHCFARKRRVLGGVRR